LLLDGGDSWQGLGHGALDQGPGHGRRLQAARRRHHDRALGVHARRRPGEEIVERDFAGRIEFLAQNVQDGRFRRSRVSRVDDPPIGGVPVAIIGQAYPYTPIANPRYFVADWTFGIQEESLQKAIDEARGKGAQAVVLLSHNGMDIDLKLASRVRGLDAILGGHTHDGVPAPSLVANPGGRTLVTNAGSNGKSWRFSTSTFAAARSPTSATNCCRCSRTCLRLIPRWPR
jgi:sulfur-oxidizing protein SoxB